METYQYRFKAKHHLDDRPIVEVGVAGSGNLEVIVKPIDRSHDKNHVYIKVNTVVTGFKETWDAVIRDFIDEYPFAGLELIVNDAGATPAVVSLRLRQAIETYQKGYLTKTNYLECDGRNRVYSLTDPNSFTEFLIGDEKTKSINLPLLGMQPAADDGVIVGEALIAKKHIGIIAQQKDFIGGSVGEVHGAKIIGLIKYAIKKQKEAIVLLIDSGGVRLQEANVGEIEISEIIRAILDARSAGIITIGVICGNNGAFGGMGIICGALDYLIINQVGRIGVSGAEVIQAVKGAEHFDSRDRPLVWRVYGGRTRYYQGAAQKYTTNMIQDIRQSIIDVLLQTDTNQCLNLSLLQKEHEKLKNRAEESIGCEEQEQWLQKHDSEIAKKNIFNLSDADFLDLCNEDGKNEA